MDQRRHQTLAWLLGGLFFAASTAFAGLADDLEKKTADLEKKLPQVTVKETEINVSPQVRYYLPNGSLDLALQQSYKDSILTFGTKYDFVDNFMGFSLDYLYDTRPVPIGLAMSDRVDFSEKFSGSEYLQRTQAIGPYAQYPLNPFTKLKGSMRYETNYTDSVTTKRRIEQGRNVVGEFGIFNNTVREAELPSGGVVSLNLIHSFKNLGSDYNYTRAEFDFRHFFYPLENNFIEYEFQANYPIDIEKRPMFSTYYVGGYRILRGYSFKEFSGDALIYSTVKYNLPLHAPKPEDKFGFTFSMYTWDFFVEAAKIGDKDIYTHFGGIKASAGTGIGHRIVLLNRLPIQTELSVAKAFDDRDPQFYFTISTIYYTWRND